MNNQKTILIVDDSKLNIKILSDILEKTPHRLALARSGEMALEFVEMKKPDLILLDIMMPEIDGFEVCKRLKENPNYKNIPIIFISGLDKSKDIVKGFEAGAVDYIVKPFQKEVVLARVDTHLKLNEAKEELKKTNEEQNILLENIDVQVWYLHNPGKYGKANSSRASFLGFKKEEIENKEIRDFMNKEISDVCIAGNKEVFEKKEKIISENWRQNYDGEKRLLKITRSPKLDQKGDVQYVVCSAIDVTEKYWHEKEVEYLSFHDKMTGLYNRRYFENELERLKDSRQLPITILVADLDKLKYINDNFGHKMGDKFIKAAADILDNSCRTEDIAARIGGDEFAIILPENGFEAAETIYERIKENIAKFNQECELPGKLSISVGFAVKKNNQQNLDEVFKKADQMMYNNKGKKTYSRN